MELVMNLRTLLARHLHEDRDHAFARDVIGGLTARPKRLSPKYFYDEAGSRPFEEITELPGYYPTPFALAILRAHAAQKMAPISADAAGVTAKFNLNLLARINRELGADFDLAAFSHQAFYNRQRQRIEMHLASRVRQRVSVCGRTIELGEAETIHTENSYKYTIDSFGALTRRAGWASVAAWTDADGYFSVQALR